MVEQLARTSEFIRKLGLPDRKTADYEADMLLNSAYRAHFAGLPWKSGEFDNGCSFKFTDLNTEAIKDAYPDMYIHPYFVYNPNTLDIIKADGLKAVLTGKESKILCIFLRSPNIVLSKQQLLVKGWGDEENVLSDNTVRLCISKLRKKIEADPRNPRVILNVKM